MRQEQSCLVHALSLHHNLLQASSLSLPCREMCEAVMSTCGCGNEQSLGSLLDKALDGLLVSLLV